MFVRWNERPMPSRQMSCGARPVTSRPSSTTVPVSGLRWPVTRLKNVVLPAPLGPMMAAIRPRSTFTLTPPTAMKPSKLLRTSRTSSTACAPQPARECLRRAGQTAGEHEEQHDEDHAQHERPGLRIGGDLLIEEDQHQRAKRRSVEGPHAAQQRHDEDLGGLGPVGEVREHAAIEDPEETAGEP